MSYSGATAASSLANPPVLVAAAVGGRVNTTSTGGNGGQLWFYNSSHGTTQLQEANFFTDAKYLGMRKGDMLLFNGCTGSSAFCGMGIIGAVSTDGAAIASTGGALSSTFN